MTRFDFENILDRKGMDALAVDAPGNPSARFAPGGPKHGESIIPMWVADMNFKTAPCIIDAIIKRANHASFGYFRTRPEYYDAISFWHEKRYGVSITAENIGYENGVLGALASALNAFTKEGDNILINAPTYIGFSRTLKDAKRNMSISMMKRDAQGTWRMDFEDMEKRIVSDNIKFAIFCSPHNPAGRVWERWEIEQFVNMCAAHDVLIFSDEIWADIVLEGRKHIPTHSVNDVAKKIVISAYAPSKTFSLAGLIGSYHVVFNKELKEKLEWAGELTHYNSLNVLSEHALIGAYSNDGLEWVDELNQVLTENINYAFEELPKLFQGVTFAKPEGTYMIFADFTKYMESRGWTSITDVLNRGWDVGVIWQNGEPFGMKNTIRMNLALPKWQIEEAFSRLKESFKN